MMYKKPFTKKILPMFEPSIIIFFTLIFSLPNFSMKKESTPPKATWFLKPKLLLNNDLLNAASIGDDEETQRLINLGANPNARNIKTHQTALHCAAIQGHLNICTILLEAGAHVDPIDSLGCTPLLWAAQEGHHEICSFLLEHEANVNATSKVNATALLKAVWMNDTYRNADDEEKEKLNETVEAICKILISYNINVNESAWDPRGFKIDPLAVAKLRSPNLALILLHAGADITLKGVSADIHLVDIKEYNPELLNFIILAPSKGMRSNIEIQFHPKLLTILLCLKKCHPALYHDIRHLILSFVPEIGSFTISRKLHGQAIPSLFYTMAALQLHEYTKSRLAEYPLDKYTKEVALQHTFTRLQQPKLLCNNPSEVFKEERNNPQPLENKKHKCVLM